jgi:hypothetical protein
VSTELDVRPDRSVSAEITRLIGRISDDATDPSGRAAPLRRSLGRLAVALTTSARAAGARAVTGGRWLSDLIVEVAPHLLIRDAATLRAAYPGRAGDDIADALVRTASRTTAAIGAAGGALAAAEFLTPPALLGLPVQLVAETLAVVAVELRLIGELHELYGRPVTGPPAKRAADLVTAWARRRGIDPLSGGFAGALGLAARRELRSRVMRRLGRNLTTFAPFLAGAVAGAGVNRRETVALADRVLADLRRAPRR